MADGNRIVELLEAGLKATGLRSRVVANNIANLETPGYRRKAVDFETALAEAMQSPSSADLRDVPMELIEPQTTPADATGNDVNLDVEVGEMVKNATMHQTYLRLLAKTYRQMEQAMGVE